MNRFLAYLFLSVLTFALGIAIMIYGWGLEPQSWGWILGGGVAGRGILALLEYLTQKEKRSNG